LTLVDVRRGFVFDAYEIRTPFYVVTPAHAVMLAAGLSGMMMCHTGLRTLERRLTAAHGM
jgi:hypothetical protein